MRQIQKGFTLVELILVMAIIGVLASIVGPQAYKYLARARDTQRLSVINQYQKTLILYAKSQDGKFPSDTPSGLSTGENTCLGKIFSLDPIMMNLLGGKVASDPGKNPAPIPPCTSSGSLYYREIKEVDYSDSEATAANGYVVQKGMLIGVRMEMANNANYGTASLLPTLGKSDIASIQAKQSNYKGTISSNAPDFLYISAIPTEK